LQPHRPPIDGARQHGGVEGDVVGAVVTVAAGPSAWIQRMFARLQTERPGDVARSGKTPWLWVQTASLRP